MARDVAQRDLDQAGFRITNLGAPQAAGDATSTDHAAVPLPASGEGAPGRSFLAAPADHVHPAPAGSQAAAVVPVDFDSEQEVVGSTEEVVAQRFIDFAPFASGNVSASFTASVSVDSGNATFNVRLGGTSGAPDGTVIATILIPAPQAPSFQDRIALGQATPRPTGAALLKITAAADTPAGTCRIKGHRVVLTG